MLFARRGTPASMPLNGIIPEEHVGTFPTRLLVFTEVVAIKGRGYKERRLDLLVLHSNTSLLIGLRARLSQHS